MTTMREVAAAAGVSAGIRPSGKPDVALVRSLAGDASRRRSGEGRQA